MDIAQKKKRKEARRLFFTGEATSNAEIARRLGLKPHTVGRYRREEDWDGLRLKVDRRAAEKMMEQMATDRVHLNVKHFRLWDVLLTRTLEALGNSKANFERRSLAEFATIIDKAQKGQRLARGMALDGQTEEEIRTQSQAEVRHLIDVFTESVREHISDEEIRDRIRQSLLEAISDKPDEGPGKPGDESKN